MSSFLENKSPRSLRPAVILDVRGRRDPASEWNGRRDPPHGTVDDVAADQPSRLTIGLA